MGLDETGIDECVELYKPARMAMDHHAAGRKMMKAGARERISMLFAVRSDPQNLHFCWH